MFQALRLVDRHSRIGLTPAVEGCLGNTVCAADGCHGLIALVRLLKNGDDLLNRVLTGLHRSLFAENPITSSWPVLGSHDTADDTVDRLGYTYCVLDRLTAALRRRDIFVRPSLRYADLRLGMLADAAWSEARPQLCRALGRIPDATAEVAALAERLNAVYHTTSAELPSNAAVRMQIVEMAPTAIYIVGAVSFCDQKALCAMTATMTASLPFGIHMQNLIIHGRLLPGCYTEL